MEDAAAAAGDVAAVADAAPSSNMSANMSSVAPINAAPAVTHPQVVVVEQPVMECPLPAFDVVNTPSRQDGISEELEKDLRIIGCSLIQNAGIIMKQPQV